MKIFHISYNKYERFSTSGQDFFKQQSGAKPKRRIIKADEAVNIQRRLAVIPRTGVDPAQNRPGNIFSDKNAACVYTSSKDRAFAFQDFADGRKKTGHTVDREHPDRRVAHQCGIFFFIGMEAGEKNLHTPARRSTGEKIMFHTM
ncbi:hypothetical protein CLOHYLEM_06614 [[Clostridium] hylemonae DSM 15053]|uniref:Uncharacterized protein n=1 Tax=[Clostridium] hylemonae DSM 15053 TaxID=553973 RepID=C0C3F3_9FIRM|nr:hypothetical protein CLOHYLEM_06614 [[Clostridium] hylemonae DSM 15053]